MARIQKNLLLTPNDIAKFQKLAEKAQQITIENLKKDEEYEDAPDEFIGKFLKKIIAFSYSRISVNKETCIYNQSVGSREEIWISQNHIFAYKKSKRMVQYFKVLF